MSQEIREKAAKIREWLKSNHWDTVQSRRLPDTTAAHYLRMRWNEETRQYDFVGPSFADLVYDLLDSIAEP